MIRHLVMFRFKPETTQQQQSEFISMLEALPGKIEEILDFEVGRDVIRSARAFDVALVATYADLAALERYTVHPDHLPVVARAKEVCAQVGSVDYEIQSRAG
jgi:hypothetical protein